MTVKLMFELIAEASRRGGTSRAILDDAGNQGRHGMDAPDTVDDGVEWYADADFPEISGAIPRAVPLREVHRD